MVKFKLNNETMKVNETPKSPIKDVEEVFLISQSPLIPVSVQELVPYNELSQDIICNTEYTTPKASSNTLVNYWNSKLEEIRNRLESIKKAKISELAQDDKEYKKSPVYSVTKQKLHKISILEKNDSKRHRSILGNLLISQSPIVELPNLETPRQLKGIS